MSKAPISVVDFPSHVAQLKQSNGFAAEFETIKEQPNTANHSNLEYNRTKNRYPQIVAYDNSRVHLQPIEGVEGSDYINANFQDGYRKENAYIASQGPLPQTYADFWRMVWEQRTDVIVMITQLEEGGRVKCGQYWPSEGTQTYGHVQVTLVDTEQRPTHTLRTLRLAYINVGGDHGNSDAATTSTTTGLSRTVYHFQYTAWPEHGVPDSPTGVLALRHHARSVTSSSSSGHVAGPPVVHCSAGVGRTGAYIVIDAMLERAEAEGSVDAYGLVTRLRAQRNLMVQTLDQYVFVHDAIAQALTSSGGSSS